MRTAGSEWRLPDVYARVYVSCASIQCAVIRGESIYCSKNIGRPWWKGKEAGKKHGAVGRLTGRGIGGGRAEWKVKEEGTDAVAKTHVARQGKNRATGKKRREMIQPIRRQRVDRTVSLDEACSLAVPRTRERGVRYPPPRTPTSNGTNKPKVPLVDFWA